MRNESSDFMERVAVRCSLAFVASDTCCPDRQGDGCYLLFVPWAVMRSLNTRTLRCHKREWGKLHSDRFSRGYGQQSYDNQAGVLGLATQVKTAFGHTDVRQAYL